MKHGPHSLLFVRKIFELQMTHPRNSYVRTHLYRFVQVYLINHHDHYPVFPLNVKYLSRAKCLE